MQPLYKIPGRAETKNPGRRIAEAAIPGQAKQNGKMRNENIQGHPIVNAYWVCKKQALCGGNATF